MSPGKEIRKANRFPLSFRNRGQTLNVLSSRESLDGDRATCFYRSKNYRTIRGRTIGRGELAEDLIEEGATKSSHKPNVRRQ